MDLENGGRGIGTQDNYEIGTQNDYKSFIGGWKLALYCDSLWYPLTTTTSSIKS